MASGSSRQFRLTVVFTLVAGFLALSGCSGLRAGPKEPEMTVIPAGEIHLGVAQPPTLKSFELAKFDVTRDEFAVFAGETHFSGKGCTTFNKEGDFEPLPEVDWENPGFPQTGRDPVVCLNYDDMMSYIRWLSAKTGRTYRLPSETELRYAARAGQFGTYIWEDEAAQCGYANGADRAYHDKYPDDSYFNNECSDGFVFTSPVGSFKPNGFGLFDAFGNVHQRVADCYTDDLDAIPLDGSPSKTSSAQTGGYTLIDTNGKITHHTVTDYACAGQVALGGSWAWAPFVLATSYRRMTDPTERSAEIGFRLARTLR